MDSLDDRHATWWIRQAVTRAVADQGRTIRVPVHMSVAAGRIARASQKLRQELGRDPAPEEVAGKTGIPAEKIREIMTAAQETVSLETPVGDDGRLGDIVPDGNSRDLGEAVGCVQLRERLEEVLGTLKPREEQVLRLRFGFDDGRARTLEEIGRELGVTREFIRQVEGRALRKLRSPARSRKLRDFLD